MNWVEIIEGDETTLPKVGQKVLVFTKWGEFEISELFPHNYTKYEEVEDGLFKKLELSANLWNGNYPTHWAELHTPPKIEDVV